MGYESRNGQRGRQPTLPWSPKIVGRRAQLTSGLQPRPFAGKKSKRTHARRWVVA